MNYEEIKTLVENNPRKTFILYWKNGCTSKGRLFVSKCGHVCIFRKRSRKWGDILCGVGDAIVKVEVQGTHYDPIKTFKKNVSTIIKYLSASGLWSPMLETAKQFLTLTDKEILAAKKDWDSYRALMDGRLKGYNWFGCDSYCTLFDDRCIKTVNYDRWTREYDRRLVANAIAEKKRYHSKWRKGYDNSLEINCEVYPRGWYSEEYKDCANGHYYYLLDEAHILFGEND